jgi:hypothetical protein
MQQQIDPYKADFRNFLYLVWKYLNLPDPTPVQYDIAGFLQNGPRRRVIEAFRGVGKSWITVAYVCWRLYCDPQLKIEVVSASKNLADNFSTFCLQLIEGLPILHSLKPRDEQRNSKIQFDVGPARESKDPSVKSVGITGQITGTRADLLVADDIEVANNSMTQAARQKLAESVKEFDAILKPGGDIVYLGTPQTEESIYNELPKRGYEVRIWPSRFPTADQTKRYGGRLAPFIKDQAGEPGEPTDPKRFSFIDLAEREASYGRSGFALQFQLDTSLSDADRFPLKINDLILMECDPDLAPERLIWGNGPQIEVKDVPNVGFDGDRFHRPAEILGDRIPYTGCVMAIDPSGRGKDELAYAVVKMLNGYCYLTDAGGIQGGYEDKNLKALVSIAQKQKVNHVIIESNFGDGMFTSLIKPFFTMAHPCVIEEVRHSKQKEMRIIDTLEPVLNRHRLVVDPEVIRKDFRSVQGYPAERQRDYMLLYQLSRITKDRGALRQDDRLDALAMAVAYWVEAMAQDEQKNMQRRQESEQDKILKDFIAHALKSPLRQTPRSPKAQGMSSSNFAHRFLVARR